MQVPTPAVPRLFHFAAGDHGQWHIEKILPVIGETLALAPKLAISSGNFSAPADKSSWVLHGKTSNDRYVERAEKTLLQSRQEGLGRAHATCAALIPIRKNAAWWALTQDERRAIFEEKSHHNEIGLKYLPEIARKLHHCRDLDADQPFDFLTWFEYAPEHTAAFEDLVAALRATLEWTYVDWEVDVRLIRAS